MLVFSGLQCWYSGNQIRDAEIEGWFLSFYVLVWKEQVLILTLLSSVFFLHSWWAFCIACMHMLLLKWKHLSYQTCLLRDRLCLSWASKSWSQYQYMLLINNVKFVDQHLNFHVIVSNLLFSGSAVWFLLVVLLPCFYCWEFLPAYMGLMHLVLNNLENLWGILIVNLGGANFSHHLPV